MKISASNIGWRPEDDDTVYRMMRGYGFAGLEIAPTRVIPEAPYDHIPQAVRFADTLREQYGLVISSMQSIWFGITDRVFGTAEERTQDSMQ